MARKPLETLKSVAVSVRSMSLSDDGYRLSVHGIDLDSGRGVTVSVADDHAQRPPSADAADQEQLVLVLTLERVS